MLWLISGPSSVGKSVFLRSHRFEELTGLRPGVPVFMGPALASNRVDLPLGDYIVHYNMLRPVTVKTKTPSQPVHWRPVSQFFRQVKTRTKQMRGKTEPAQVSPTEQLGIDFDADRAWNVICQQDVEKKAIVLVAKRRTLLQRSANRQVIESTGLTRRKEKRYPFREWLDIFENTDLVQLYQTWCLTLEERGIPYILVDANNDLYQVIEGKQTLSSPEYALESKYTKEQITELLSNKRFPYHRVNMPYGLHTRGRNRSSTRDLIFPQTLSGKSVLDVGCGLGYFCFEAENRGARRVVGVELNEERLQQATLLKDINGSEVVLFKQDILITPIVDHFDYVLLLNIIHHLKEPIRAMKELASITQECLIIEFPTLADPKFRRTVNKGPSVKNDSLPLIGVSSIPAANQTFVFTPTAIERILMDHDHLFERIDFLPSPMDGRMIAICRKPGSGGP